MSQTTPKPPTHEALIKVVVPKQLKHELQSVATSRNISLSALVRLVVTDYLKSRK
jgi:hypothetical protein